MTTAARNGRQAAPAAAPQPPPTRIAGALGPPVVLGGEPYHLAVLTTWGVKTMQDWFRTDEAPPTIAYGEASFGTMLVEGVIQTGRFETLREFLARVVAEELPEGVEYVATPDELAALADRFFDQSGLRFFELIAKNSASRAAVLIQARIERAAQTLALQAEAEAQAPETPPEPETSPPTGTASLPISSTASS